ncbi:MAG TPA: DUF6624 domain-containing protein [Actinomycetota bacterium]|nr:DUF6624 domain-containing protein [Actinomycetota bacterium]
MIDDALSAELQAMTIEEQEARAELVRRGVLDQEHPLRAMHLRHANRLRDVLDANGWPGTSLVGPEGSEAAWLVAQSIVTVDLPLAERCVSLLGAAVSAGESPARHLAILTDAVRWQEGRPQVYGSMHVVDPGLGTVVPWPIEDPEGVDERRAAAGLPELAAHTRSLQERHRTERGL